MAFNVRQIFAALNDAGVDYVIVGGMAVILHGYLSATADLDLVIGFAPANCKRAAAALDSIELRPRLPVAIEEFADPRKREEWIEQRNMLVFQLWDPANPMRSIGLFTREPIAFDSLLRDAVSKNIDGIRVCVASIEHPIAMKQAAGRPRDLEDIAKLRQIQDEGRMTKVDGGDRTSDAFRKAEVANLRAWMKLSDSEKVDFFEEMIELAYHSGALRPERLAMRD
ncbi:MAG: nucleotidyltransferase [Rhodanobacteraceae bacterium]